MPRPAGREILLKFKRKGNKQGKFDPVTTFRKRNAISGYLATMKGKEQQHANEYSSLRNNVVNSRKRADKKGYSNAKRKRKKKATLKQFIFNHSAVIRRIKEWAKKALARQECITVAELKETVLEPTERRHKTKATGE